MTTLIFALFALGLAAVLVWDMLAQRAAKRDRAVMRKLHTYLASLPPARPW